MIGEKKNQVREHSELYRGLFFDRSPGGYSDDAHRCGIAVPWI